MGSTNPISATHISSALPHLCCSLLPLAISVSEQSLLEECRLHVSPETGSTWGRFFLAYTSIYELGGWLKTSHCTSVGQEAEESTARTHRKQMFTGICPCPRSCSQ